MRKLMLVALFCICSSLVSCESADETDDLAKAQECLDAVPQSNPASASECLQYVEKYTSQQASILKCSIYMTSGGLVENKVVSAYKALEDNSIQNKEAAFMGLLALDVPDVNSGFTTATLGDTHCQATGVPGLTYLSSIIVAGSYMAKTMAALGMPLVPGSPSPSIANLVDQCTAEGATAINPLCLSNLDTLGSTVVTLSGSYCATEAADDAICADINSAVASAGGNSANVGQALFCYLSNPPKTYDLAQNKCI